MSNPSNSENGSLQSNMRKVALTALAGTSIEWYDFFLYGAAAALVFPTVFFGEAEPATAYILSFLLFYSLSEFLDIKYFMPVCMQLSFLLLLIH